MGSFLAVKEIKLRPGMQESVVREIKILRQVNNHPHCVKLIGAEQAEVPSGPNGKLEKVLYIFMEYVPGGSLTSVAKTFKSTTLVKSLKTGEIRSATAEQLAEHEARRKASDEKKAGIQSVQTYNAVSTHASTMSWDSEYPSPPAGPRPASPKAKLREATASNDAEQKKTVSFVNDFGSVRSGGSGNLLIHTASSPLEENPTTVLGGLDEQTVQVYTHQALEGLTFLHKQGMVHRDIKGDNLLVASDGTVKLADFGTAVVVSQAEGLVGTPWFMAPEVIFSPDDSKAYDVKADTWSLGGTVVELLTGKPPLIDELTTAEACWYAIAKGKKDPYIDLPDDVSKECKDFVRQCFERNRWERPSAEELLKHPWMEGIEERLKGDA
eukprot:TRINITY_DN8644_c0_g2_i1.p2 TRINITY_DN8644_c0_g2~~TRINITY_DN8644_c0_g2_i1.p2  ORF type:complete len:382 (+),score=134.52 TRINITY_DN8644_c0_g2_i1:2-1147(+)